ncbi:hypothetical protein [Halomarina rubra]|uniref:DUF2188 domain-containing protein n=1 Tax=Halomarina rubra TaxID=2071873 RepID=A0ABD6APS0_9EURY|nr:hypothetical protein [Halomarina rubra]
MTPNASTPVDGAVERPRSWLYCETCEWTRTVRSASCQSAFALAEEDARMHAALTDYEGESHRVHAIDAETGQVVVRD